MQLFAIIVAGLLYAISIFGEDVTLTDENFSAQVASGTWMIKFFSPYCGYCKRLAPIWEQFSNEQGLSANNLHIGELDCTQYGSICDQNKVNGYPTINLFHNGQYIEEYTGEQNAQAMAEYAKSNAQKYI
ncbi:hypothetical protein K7432_012425 [Basidiobolus ranarum]|uniref:Thioredoxin domain-containing protein n=1 Tax=Basidiobolus ranarum TaxID=34480 RepID=A0ABR2VS92_9FUNG